MRGANQTLTVWNRWRDPVANTDTWYRHVVPRASWEYTIVSSVTASGTVTGAAYNLLIDEHPDYRKRADWLDLSPEEKLWYWTLGDGDSIGLGLLTFAITGKPGATASDARNKFAPDFFTVKTISDNTEGYKRGRHYRVTGV